MTKSVVDQATRRGLVSDWRIWVFSAIGTATGVSALTLQVVERFRRPTVLVRQAGEGPDGFMEVVVSNPAFVSAPILKAGVASGNHDPIPFVWIAGEDQPLELPRYGGQPAKYRPPEVMSVPPRDSRRAQLTNGAITGLITRDRGDTVILQPYCARAVGRARRGRCVRFDLRHHTIEPLSWWQSWRLSPMRRKHSKA